jgi:hypothetical protein
MEAFGNGAQLGEVLAAAIGPLEQLTGEDAAIETARTLAMVEAYYLQWADSRKEWAWLATEERFTIDLGSVEVQGVVDALALHVPSQTPYLVEYKTTSDYIATFGADYWLRLGLDAQLTLYAEAIRRTRGYRPEILYDVVRKPAGRPASKERVVRRNGESEDTYLARKAASKEDPHEFRARMMQTMAEAPYEYMVRHTISRTTDEANRLLSELAEIFQEMDGYKGSYPRNDGACTAKYGVCPYLSVCTGVGSLEEEGFLHLAEEPSEPRFALEDDCPI